MGRNAGGPQVEAFIIGKTMTPPADMGRHGEEYVWIGVPDRGECIKNSELLILISDGCDASKESVKIGILI